MNAKNDNKVMACVDQSAYADHVADYAAWASLRMSAPLEFLHVIDRHPEIGKSDDHSGALGMDAQEKLLDQLSAEDQVKARSAREAGRLFLNQLRMRAMNAGATEVDVRQRYGSLQETLTEQEEGVRLIVLGRRGESAQATQRDLGRNVERIVRGLHKPILTVTDGFSAPSSVMIAFDGGAVTRRGVEMIAASPMFRGLPIHILMTGNENAEAPKQMEWARNKLHVAGFEVVMAIQPGDTESTIAKYIAEQSIDLLIMGSYGHSMLHGLLFGSKTTDLLRASRIPTLLLR
jgi:nucleotide-binding universal stress UspA family protein